MGATTCVSVSRLRDRIGLVAAVPGLYRAHDNAYLVAWLVDALDVAGAASFATNVEWLRGLLEARGFPMDAFRRNLRLVGAAGIGS